jgi:hypothetical protein
MDDLSVMKPPTSAQWSDGEDTGVEFAAQHSHQQRIHPYTLADVKHKSVENVVEVGHDVVCRLCEKPNAEEGLPDRKLRDGDFVKALEARRYSSTAGFPMWV